MATGDIIRAGLSRSIWHTACDIIFAELCEGRGVTVPNLGTFAIDTQSTFQGTQGVRTDKRPCLMLSANFERLGVRLPAARPSTGAVRLIGWQQVALRCGKAVDRDLVQRSVSSLLAAFAAQVAAMAATGARSFAGLDLGRCGTLRIVRCGEQGRARWREPRVIFTSELEDAIRLGRLPSRLAPSTAASPADIDGVPSDVIRPPSTIAPPGLTPSGRPALGPLRPYISLERLCQMMQLQTAAWAETVEAAAPRDVTRVEVPDREPNEPTEASAEASALRALAVADATLAAEAVAAGDKVAMATVVTQAKVGTAHTANVVGVTSAAGAASAVGAPSAAGAAAWPPPRVGREPLLPLPQTAVEVDEWAASKHMSTWMCERMPRPTEAERRRRSLLDEDNLRTARQRTARQRSQSGTGATAPQASAGVLTLLRRLSPSATATAAPVAAPERVDHRERGKRGPEPEEEEPSAEERRLLEQKRALEVRLQELEQQLLETASVRSRATAASARSSLATRRSVLSASTHGRSAVSLSGGA